MRCDFVKMHGLGNDFIVLDARDNPLPAISARFAKSLADRREGIGCDQMILLEPSDTADFRMRIFNSDGTEVEACGNASRAVALLHGREAQVETDGGTLSLSPGDGGACVELPAPRFDWDAIPLAYAMDTLHMPVGWPLEHGQELVQLENPVAVNVGNPHVIFFVDDADTIPLTQIGPVIECDPLFPEKVNVNVASVIGTDHLKLHVWERGAGLTRACGTGACATAIAAMRRGLTGKCTKVTLPGGDLVIEWRDDGTILMTGPATESYRGSFVWEDYA